MSKKKKRKTESGGKGSGVSARVPRGSAPTSALRFRYQLIISLFLLVVGISVLYPELVFQDKVFLAGDVESAASLATPIQQGMSEGEYPQWNPYLFSGMPSYGSLSYNPNVYPVGVLTHIMSTYLGFPGFTWLLFHIFLLGLGVWLLLFDRGVHFLIAAGAGILMMWMPNHVAVGVHGHGSQASAVAFMPFALLFWDRLWRGKGVVVNMCVLVIVLGIQFLRAHLQISYYTFGLIGLHLIFFGTLRIRDAFRSKGVSDPPIFGFAHRIRGGNGSHARRAAILEVAGAVLIVAVIVGASLLVSAVLFLPVQDYAQYSIRGAAEGGGLDYNYATSWSLHPFETLTFIIPFAFGFGKSFYYGYMPFTDYPNYVGVVVLFFAIMGVVLVRSRFSWFLVFIAVVATLVAFGKHLPVIYNPLFKYLPYFNKFRVPVMVLIVQQLAIILLFGLGLSAIFRVDPRSGRRKALVGVGVAAAILVIVVMSYGYWTDSFAGAIAKKIRNVRSAQEQVQVATLVGGLLFKDLVKFSILLLANATLVLLFFRKVLPALPCFLLILGVGLLDLYLVDRHIMHPEKLFRVEAWSLIKSRQEAQRFQEMDGLISFLQNTDGFYRVFPMTHPSAALSGDFRTNRYMNFGISSIGGYHPAKLSLYEEFLQGLGSALQRGNFQMVNMLNVKYLVTSNPLPEHPFFVEAWRGTSYDGREKFVYENVNVMPRVFLVGRYEVESEALDRLVGDQTLDVSQTVLLEKPPHIEPVTPEGASARITRYGFNELHVDADLPNPAILVLSEIYYPRWQVWVDDEPGEVIRANHLLRAVPLSSGSHKLVFRYDDSLLKQSRRVSVATILLTSLILVTVLVFNNWSRISWKRSS